MSALSQMLARLAPESPSQSVRAQRAWLTVLAGAGALVLWSAAQLGTDSTTVKAMSGALPFAILGTIAASHTHPRLAAALTFGAACGAIYFDFPLAGSGLYLCAFVSLGALLFSTREDKDAETVLVFVRVTVLLVLALRVYQHLIEPGVRSGAFLTYLAVEDGFVGRPLARLLPASDIDAWGLLMAEGDLRDYGSSSPIFALLSWASIVINLGVLGVLAHRATRARLLPILPWVLAISFGLFNEWLFGLVVSSLLIAFADDSGAKRLGWSCAALAAMTVMGTLALAHLL